MNMSAAESNEDEENQKGLMVFGRDVSTIPCFRSSLLYGMGTGAVSGLAYFMFTSKVRMATHVAYGSFFCTTFIYWTYCRYQWSEKRFGIGQLNTYMKKPPIRPYEPPESTPQDA
ncbi:hypothetical protein B566_EDAN016935 [Ephemera danica]|nr:hypothetical protein B566_EDAN016935 [Ephemera danica]